MLEFLKPLPLIFCNIYYITISRNFHGAMKKQKSANQNSPICMKTSDIKLFGHV